jgi:hypothetical protein
MDQQTARSELASIRSLMADSQAFLSGTWQHQLLWGTLAAIGLSATWVAAREESYTAIAWIWGVTLVSGWLCSVWLMRRWTGSPVRNVATRAFGGIWLSLGVTLTLIGTVSIYSGALEPSSLPGVLALVFGAGYFASGFMAGMPWLSAVGVAWWASGVALLFRRGPGGMLVLAVLVLLLEVVPALVLRNRERAGAARS